MYDTLHLPGQTGATPSDNVASDSEFSGSEPLRCRSVMMSFRSNSEQIADFRRHGRQSIERTRQQEDQLSGLVASAERDVRQGDRPR